MDDLRVLLKGFNDRTGAAISAVVTRSGMPVAFALPEDVPADNVATMAATLLGALEVLFASLKGAAPDHVLVETTSGVLAIHAVTPKTIFVALTRGSREGLEAAVAEAATRARAFVGRDV